MLTAVHLLLRFVGTSFQVYLSGQIGAAGIGLVQLVMSVGTLAMVAGIGGVRTATMYLTAEELGRKHPERVSWVLSGCFLYSITFSCSVGLALYRFAPWIAENWIGDSRIIGALRLYAAYLPIVCLCAVMTGYFTAANRISTLAAVEVAEQLFSMALTMAALKLWAGFDPSRACLCVILGSSLGACMTLCVLIFLRQREPILAGPRILVTRRIADTALPLALADDLKSGITTMENLMVPKRLALHTATGDPLAAFGSVNGMVFPVIMFPAAILFALTELLIPEIARCAAAEKRQRIRYLATKGLRLALLYSLVFGGLIHLLAEELAFRLYKDASVAAPLGLYALLIPMLYCDCLTDAIIKGLGEQKICVRYNILTAAMDILFLFLLLPRYGMTGYFCSFLVTHLVNFCLSFRRLQKRIIGHLPIRIPLLSGFSWLFALGAAGLVAQPVLRCCCFLLILGSLLVLFQIVTRIDLLWLAGLLRKKTSPDR